MTSSSPGMPQNPGRTGGAGTRSSTAQRQPDPGGPDELGALFEQLGGRSDQKAIGHRAGLSQSKVSRAVRGTHPLSGEEAGRLAVALGADADQRARIVELSEIAHELTIVGRGDLLREQDKIQRRVRLLESSVPVVRSWQPNIIPGALQTPDYTLAVVRGDGEPEDPPAEWFAERAARRARLEESRPFWHQLISEAALRWGIDSHAVMAEQLDHLTALSERSNVQLGILPLDRIGDVTPPPVFHIYGRRAVEIAVYTRTSFLTDPADVAAHEQQFDRLAGAALYDRAARAVLGKLARRHRNREAK